VVHGGCKGNAKKKREPFINTRRARYALLFFFPDKKEPKNEGLYKNG
jgi:hypothetical protein